MRQNCSYTSPPSALPYNPNLSLWLSVDPLSDKYPNLSPYVYCGNNPVRLVDVDGRELVDADDIIIYGANNSSLTIKTDLCDFHFNSDMDFGGNLVYENAEKVAIGYECGVNANAGAGIGVGVNGFKQSVMFLGGDYAGYWYQYAGCGGELNGSISAEATVGVQAGFFIATFEGDIRYLTPESFAGFYAGGPASCAIEAGMYGASANVSVSRADTDYGTWRIFGGGVSAAVGPQFGSNVGGGGHAGTTTLLTPQVKTEERSWFSRLINFIFGW